jgi:hypothetical protein
MISSKEWIETYNLKRLYVRTCTISRRFHIRRKNFKKKYKKYKIPIGNLNPIAYYF